jgi:hypothetical protein
VRFVVARCRQRPCAVSSGRDRIGLLDIRLTGELFHFWPRAGQHHESGQRAPPLRILGEVLLGIVTASSPASTRLENYGLARGRTRRERTVVIFIWRRWGILVVLLALLGVGTGFLISAGFEGMGIVEKPADGSAQWSEGLFLGLGWIIGGGYIWLFDIFVNRPHLDKPRFYNQTVHLDPPQLLPDGELQLSVVRPVLVQPPQSTFFFVPFKYWCFVVVALGCFVIVSSLFGGNSNSASRGLSVGQCITDKGFSANTAPAPVDCEQDDAVYELASKGNGAATCPDGKRADSDYMTLSNSSHTYCFLLNVREGACYHIDDARNGFEPVACASNDATVKIERRVDGSTEETQCETGTKGLSFRDPARVYCLAAP